MTASGSFITNGLALSLLVVLTVYTFRPALSNEPAEWDYLWDDGGNFYQNRRLSLSWANVRWAVKDGVIHSVYEPVSLTVKILLHSALRALGVAITAQTYRIINLIAHVLNVCLVFLVGNCLLIAANDYEFYEGRTNAISGGEEGGHNPTLQYLQRHRVIGMIGCWIGSALFAVHPLQAQIIGWASCMSYPFACTFALISYWHYIKHRVVMRNWRRSKREVVGIAKSSAVNEPFHIFGLLQRFRTGGKTRRRKSGNKTSMQTKIDLLGHETFLATRHKIISLIFYFLATFSKAPAIVLPALFVVSDVYLFSCPLSVSPRGTVLLDDILAARVKTKSTRGQRDENWNPMTKLCRLILRSVRAWVVFLITTPVLAAIVVRGNKASKAVKISLFRKIKTAAWSMGWYVEKLIAPTDLRATVEMRQVSIVDDWGIGICLVVIPLATIVMLLRSMKTTPTRVLTCAWGSMVVLLLPALMTTDHSGNYVVAGDRYMYIPLCMAAPLLGAVACGSFTLTSGRAQQADTDEVHLAGGPIPNEVSVAPISCPLDQFDASFIAVRVDGSKKSKKGKSSQSIAIEVGDNNRFEGFLGILFLVFIILASSYASIFTTPQNLNFWRNSQVLWERNLIYNPESMNGHVTLASHYSTLAEKDPNDPVLVDKALLHAEKAVALDPSVYENKFNLAAIYLQREELDESTALFRAMLKENPRHPLTPRVVVDYAIGLHKMGEWGKAQRELEQAVKMREPRAKGALEAILKMRSKPDAEEKQRQWWKNKKEELQQQRKRRGGAEEKDQSA